MTITATRKKKSHQIIAGKLNLVNFPSFSLLQCLHLWEVREGEANANIDIVIDRRNLRHDGSASNIVLSLVNHHKTADDQVAFELSGALQWPSEVADVAVITAAAADCHSTAITAAYYKSAQLVCFYHGAPTFLCSVHVNTIGSSVPANQFRHKSVSFQVSFVRARKHQWQIAVQS